MPVVRVSLRKGKSAEFLRQVSSSIHQAMVEAFDVPEADCFQLFHQHEAEEIVYDRNYLGGPRSENYLLVAVTAGKERSSETKRRFYRALVDRLSKSPGIATHDVMVVLSTTKGEDWSFANGVCRVDVKDA